MPIEDINFDRFSSPVFQPRYNPEVAKSELAALSEKTATFYSADSSVNFMKSVLRLWSNAYPDHGLSKYLNPALNPLVYGTNLARFANRLNQVFSSWGWPAAAATHELLRNDQLTGAITHAVAHLVEHELTQQHPTEKGSIYSSPEQAYVDKFTAWALKVFSPETIDEQINERLFLLARGAYDTFHPILPQVPAHQLQTLLNQTEFIRRNGELSFMREEWAPVLDKTHLTMGDFGPGHVSWPNILPHRQHFTFEPYLLADIDPRLHIVVQDLRPESQTALAQFDGNLLVTANWLLPETDIDADTLKYGFGENYLEYLDRIKRYYRDFLNRNSGREFNTHTFSRPGFAFAPIQHILINPAIGKRILVAPPGDLAFRPIHEPLDAAYFHLNNPYLDTDSVMFWGLATLARIIHQLVPGGFLFTDPHEKLLPNGEYVPMTHSPSAEMAQALGLKLAADLTGDHAVVFYKDAPSNALVTYINKGMDDGFERNLSPVAKTSLRTPLNLSPTTLASLTDDDLGNLSAMVPLTSIGMGLQVPMGINLIMPGFTSH